MTLLLAGLILFFGIHSVRLVAGEWRDARIASLGYLRWRGLYSLVSITGFVLIVIGFGIARRDGIVVWAPPANLRHATELLTLISAMLIAATYVPNNAIKSRVHHPMVLGTACWALGHLLANGGLAEILLFGVFLVWSIASFFAGRRRDRTERIDYAEGTASGTVMALLVGVVAWIVFAFWLHGPLIGVRPFA